MLTVKCPKCGAEMKKRNGSRGEFYGCSRFPACRGTRDLRDVEPEPIRDGKVWKETAGGRRYQIDVKADDELTARLAEKDAFAKREAEQERKAFESDPDYQRSKADRREALKAKLAKDSDPKLVEAPAKEFAPSKYQAAIFDWVKTSQPGKALVVEALAGSGKTTTGVQMMKLLPKELDTVFVAFNKHIAVELQKKAPQYVKVCTYHSLGYAACREAWKGIQVDDEKVQHLIESVLDRYTNYPLFPAIKQLVGLVKNTLSGTSEEELNALADYHGIELNGDADTIFAAVQLVIERDAEQTAVIDYDDMCWLPIRHNLKCHQYDFVFVDEAQDTNKCQIALALASLKDTGRIVAVGDRHQSLYGFRGADVDAIPNLISNLSAEVLPLSITYRCPKSIVELVHNTFPEIMLEAPEWAKDGIIRSVSEERATLEYTPGDMVLCRTNAPLVEPAFALIRRGVKAVIRGRDIGKGLTALIRKMKANGLADLLQRLEAYKSNEFAKLSAAHKNNQAQSIVDKVETIVALAEGCQAISEVEDKVEMIFSDDNAGVVFSSVHRAKGLEAERVFILHQELMPHPMAKKEWEQVQEQNIKYVAYTRSLNELIFVGG